MKLGKYPTAGADNSGISFPKLECWQPMTKVATIAAEVNKKRVLCRVSLDILVDKFGASEEDPMSSVARHRSAIQQAARNLIENQVYEEDGSVTIRAQDL